MGVTYAGGSITGRLAMREYRFLVVEEGNHVGRPQIDTDALDLKPSMFVPVSIPGQDTGLLPRALPAGRREENRNGGEPNISIRQNWRYSQH